MKFTKTTLLTIPLFVVLVFSLSFNVTTSVAQGAPFPAQTGDMFSFDINGNNSGNNEREFNLWTGTEVHRVEDHNNWETTTYDGSMDVTFARDANVSGDTWVEVQRETNTIHPSQRGGDEYVAQWNGTGLEVETDQTFPVEDRLGEHQRDDESSQVISNSTYSVIFEEIERGEIRIDFRPPFGVSSSDMPPEVAPMTSLSVSTRSMDWPINTDFNSRTVRVVSATFTLNWELNGTSTSFPLGETDPVTFSVNQTLSYKSTLEYYYDNSNGVLLGSNSSADLSYEVFMWATNVQITSDGGSTVWPGLFSSNQTIATQWSSEDSFSVYKASYGYGETRPTSSGTNRLETGDVLVYGVESEGNYDSYFKVEFSDATNTATWGREDTSTFEATGDGTADIRVWRHEPGFIDNLLVMRTETTGTESRDVTETVNGVIQPERPEENYNRPINTDDQDQFQLDFFSTPSNSTHEISAEVDQEMRFDLGGDNNDCRDCDDGGIYYPVQSYMPRTDIYRDLFVPEPETDGSPIIVINGNDFYTLNVDGLYGEYGNYTTGTVMLRMGDNPESDWVEASFTMNSTGEQAYFWDADTGVLLRIEETTNVDITLSFTGQIPDNNNPSVNNTVVVTGDVHLSNKFVLMLEQHPHEYAVGQEPPITTTTTDTTSTSTTTDTISSSTTTTSTSSDEGNGADLPLPVPIVPVLIGFVIMTVYTRKRM